MLVNAQVIIESFIVIEVSLDYSDGPDGRLLDWVLLVLSPSRYQITGPRDTALKAISDAYDQRSILTIDPNNAVNAICFRCISRTLPYEL